ncbi:MAG: DUF262 domain-containing protein [Clostridia bacterium]|nr:DUF262 domain-containing protein [Clostridia bacterium]MBQ9657341.1 DUF262 domain-containing protein [Clostridia bacterium]
MSLEKSNIAWSAKQIAAMVKNGKIDFNHIVQRSFVWERSRKSALIESMILGYPVPSIFAKRIDDGTGKRGGNIYYIMDGKQRLSTIKEYLSDEFELTDLPTVKYIDNETGNETEEDISGMTFSELPESLQDILKDVMFSIIYFDNLTKEEERELFKRLNAGKPLSTKSKVLASCRDIEGILDIGEHELFKEMLTEKARMNKNQVSIIVKAWCMLNKPIEDISFEGKSLNPFTENLVISQDERERLDEVFNLILDTHTTLLFHKHNKVAKKLYTETHMISFIPYFAKAIDSDYNSDIMAEWIFSFFDSDNGASINSEYNAAAGAGSAKPVTIQIRNKALDESFKEFFNK